MPEAMD